MNKLMDLVARPRNSKLQQWLHLEQQEMKN